MASHYNTIKCTNNGCETDANRDIILSALLYCDAHSQYDCKDVYQALNLKKFPKSIVISGNPKYWGSLKAWSEWKIDDHKYVIIRV